MPHLKYNQDLPVFLPGVLSLLLNPDQKFCHSCGTSKEVKEENNVVENTNVEEKKETHVEQVAEVKNNNAETHAHNNHQDHNQHTHTHQTEHNQPEHNQPAHTHPVNNNVPVNKPAQPSGKKKKSNPLVIILIVGGVFLLGIVGIVALVLMLILNVSNNSNKLVCESKEGNITLMYDDSGIIGYTQMGIEYDLDGQQKYAEKVGVEAYLDEFTDWFEKNTSGTCKKEELNPTPTTHDKDNEDDSKIDDDEKIPEVNTKLVGDANFGYLSIPNTWVKYKDLGGTQALQYSDIAGKYIVTIDYIREEGYTAKQLASNFLYQMQQSTEVTGVKGATVKIGKNKEYTAYQVYMLYPEDGIYLITYWFETEDKEIRYLALEGPTESNGVKLTDYLYVPESYSIKK